MRICCGRLWNTQWITHARTHADTHDLDHNVWLRSDSTMGENRRMDYEWMNIDKVIEKPYHSIIIFQWQMATRLPSIWISDTNPAHSTGPSQLINHFSPLVPRLALDTYVQTTVVVAAAATTAAASTTPLFLSPTGRLLSRFILISFHLILFKFISPLRRCGAVYFAADKFTQSAIPARNDRRLTYRQLRSPLPHTL